LTPFAPQIGRQFYEALQRGDTSAARQVIFDYEEPLLKVTLKLGYPHAYKSALYLTGHYQTNEVRPPKLTNTAEQIQPLKEFLQRKGLVS
jgi:dihydrodipicolinate synthase/N-acetylneuraminate lyase